MKGRSPQRGFILLEVVLALAFFAIAATGFITAFHRVGKAAELATSETAITRVLDNALFEMVAVPILEVGETVVELDEFGPEARLTVTTTVEELELYNKSEQGLPEMYLIRVEAEWYDTVEWQTRTAETWRNGKMYRP